MKPRIAFPLAVLVAAGCLRPQTPADVCPPGAIREDTRLRSRAWSAPPFDRVDVITICSFNIQFLGQSARRDHAGLAELVKDFDVVVIQELIAPPHPGGFPDGTAFTPNPRAAAFFDEMSARAFDYLLSEEDTGRGQTNHLNSTATEWWVVFYRPDRVQPAPDLPSGFLAADVTANPDYDRVPHAFGFRSLDRRLDFVLIPVHLRPNPGSANAQRRKHELHSIANWVSSQSTSERDFIILGDMNIESAAELANAVPVPFVSINAGCLPTNTNINGPKPYDHVLLDPRPTFTSEYDGAYGFQVMNLIDAMRGVWTAASNEPYPGDPYDHNAFRATYSDHHPVVFRLLVPEADDDP